MTGNATCRTCGQVLKTDVGDYDLCVACSFQLALESPESLDPGDGMDGWRTAQDVVSTAPIDRAAEEDEGAARIGPYRIVRLIGEGGMGEVYEAVQTQPVRRRVALKRIKAGVANDQVLGRFESERKVLLLMGHPNIARAFDTGHSPDGRPYVVMEYVEGSWITNYCDEARLSLCQRLELFLDVCRGVEHAHQRGVIHRDIKPSNILVQIEDGRPVPKIIDFGVAKDVGLELGAGQHLTRFGQFLGTLGYMSPEQSGPASFDVDTRTDVYSLGVVLYELLSGRLPFEDTAGNETGLAPRISGDDAPTCSTRLAALGVEGEEIARKRATDPRSLLRELRGDLDWILAKALERDRTRRYGSPSELAADIVRHIQHEPVLAGPPTAAYRAKKFIRRHRVRVTAAAVGVLGLVAFAILLLVDVRRIAAEREASDKVSRFFATMFENAKPDRMGAAILKDLHERAADVKRRSGASQEQIASVQAALDEALAGVNITETARRLLDEEIFAPAAKTVEKDISDEPVVSGRIENTIGEAYLHLGLYPQAEAHILRAVAIRLAAFGDDDAQTFASQKNLVNLYFSQARYAKSEALARKILEPWRRKLGADDIGYLWLLNSLGNACAMQNKLEDAAHFYRESIDGFAVVEGHRQDRLMALGNLVYVYDRLDRLEDAERTGREAVAELSASYGPEHTVTLGAMDALANVYQRQKRYGEAEALHRKTLAAERRVLGQDHPDTLATMHNLASDLTGAERLDEAEALLRDVIAARRRVLPPDHPFTAGSLYSLGCVHKKQRRYDEAERSLREALMSMRRAMTPDSPELIDTLLALGEVAALQNDRDLALSWLGQAVDGGHGDHKGLRTMAENSDLASLTGDSRFQSLIARVRRPHA